MCGYLSSTNSNVEIPKCFIVGLYIQIASLHLVFQILGVWNFY